MIYLLLWSPSGLHAGAAVILPLLAPPRSVILNIFIYADDAQIYLPLKCDTSVCKTKNLKRLSENLGNC